MSFQKGMIKFDYSNFDINNYSYLSSYEIVVGSKVKLAPPTVNICGKA